MSKKNRIILVLSAIIAVSAMANIAKIEPSLLDAENDSLLVWVFFQDKGLGNRNIASIARSTLSNRAIERRISADVEFDIYDVPVNNIYVEEVVNLGAHFRRQSRWLNAASFAMNQTTVNRIAELEFVKEIRAIRTYRRPLEPTTRLRPFEDDTLTDSFYGPTFPQLAMLGATHLHEMGYAGQGVLVGILDSGFRLTHRAFDSLNIIAQYDFMHNDTSIDYDTLAGDTDFYGFRHGTYCLGAIAAYSPGEVIGVAYHASVALAKTEDVDSEYVTEEDNWVAGMEWLDSIGVDITSSSLGYSDFDADTPYTLAHLDGNTMLTTIAADIAASRGICVINSAGNERTNQSWPTLISPSDGDSVLAVAAVGYDRVFAPFSSPGPTADGRIKPDVSAVGYGNILVNPYANEGYTSGSGTSFSCPLIAGLCAVVKSANPDLYGYNLAMAVRSSGDRVRAYDPIYSADSADFDYGWGIPQGPVAAGFTTGFYGRAIDAQSGNIIANKEISFIYFDTNIVLTTDTFGIFVEPMAEMGAVLSLLIPGYAFSLDYAVDGLGHAVRFNRLGQGQQLQVFPNPANEWIKAVAYIGQSARFTVWTTSGELVHDYSWALAEKLQYLWDLNNNDNLALANGIYIVRLATEDDSVIEKIAIVR
ncbi:S8 family serine peptidase [bacterium]|nr:S8 family serine peptidase [bacterium]